MPTSLIAPIVGGAASVGFGSLFGGGKSSAPQFTAPTFTPNPEAAKLVGNISSTFNQQADAIGGMLPMVAPGISGLRDARLSQIENARTASLSNLKDNLARRRVLGSSFGQDAAARADAEFGQQKAQASAETFLQELDLTNQLISQQFTAKRQAFQTGLDQLNLESGLSANLAAKGSEQMGANARLLTALNSQEAAARGKFFGQAFEPAFKAIGTGASDIFKSLGTSGFGAASSAAIY